MCSIQIPTPRNWQWGPVKNGTLPQERWFQFSNCTLSIFIKQHYSTTYIRYISLSWSDIPTLVVPSGSVEVIMTWLTETKFMCHKWQQICYIWRNHNLHNPLLMHDLLPRLWYEKQVKHVEQELLAHPEYIKLPRVVSLVGVALSLVFCAMFYISLFFLLSIACPSIYGFSLPLWLIQAFCILTEAARYSARGVGLKYSRLLSYITKD